jgi:putative transcriptional regulator
MSARPTRKKNHRHAAVDRVAARIGAEVRRRRVEMDWSQQELSDRSGVHREHIGRIERAVYIPGIEVALALARVFRCSLTELVE